MKFRYIVLQLIVEMMIDEQIDFFLFVVDSFQSYEIFFWHTMKIIMKIN